MTQQQIPHIDQVGPLPRRKSYSPPTRTEHIPLNLQDAILALFLAARIHSSDKAIKATAKRCAKRLPRSKRDLMFAIIDSAEPLKLVNHIAEHLD